MDYVNKERDLKFALQNATYLGLINLSLATKLLLHKMILLNVDGNKWSLF